MSDSTANGMNAQWTLARQPASGMPTQGDYQWREVPIDDPLDGQLSSRTIYLSMDPYQWVRRRSGTEEPGSVCHGRTVSQVVKSRMAEYAEGDYLFSTNGWQRFGRSGADISEFGYMFPRKLDPSIAPISTAIGVLGMLGLTAYSGLIVQCAPQPGETVVVSAASGGVGQVVGQLAKLKGCRVVGIAGATHKCAFVTETLGFDACVSHLDDDMPERLAQACPDGCDVYFENVGGKVFDAVLPVLNRRARISLCGVISQYAAAGNPRELWQQAGQRIFDERSVQVHDLFVGNYVAEYQKQFLSEMGAHVADGNVVYREDRWEGLEEAPEAFSAMLQGGNFGKTIVVVDAEIT